METIEKQHYEIDHPVVRLASLWQRRITALHGHFPKPLTPRELGQLKFLRNNLGRWTFFVIDWVLGNWQRFCQQARTDEGLESAPPKPHIGFLLAHLGTAVNL